MAGIWSNFKVDIYRRNGVFITSTDKVIMARSESELDTIGSCKIQIPLNETPAQSQFVKNRVCVVTLDVYGKSSPLIVGQFIVHNVKEKVGTNGKDVLEISGPDLLYEFTYETLGYTTISNGAGGPSADALQDVFDIYAATSVIDWSYSAYGSGADNAYIVGSGESVWDAILTIVKANDGHVSLGNKQPGIQNGNETYPLYVLNFWWSHDFTGGFPLAFDELTLDNNNLDSPMIRPVLDFTHEEETAETVTRVYVYGAGMGDERFTVENKNIADPLGFTSYPSNSLVVNNTLEAVIDQPQITRVLNISNIKPEDPDDATARQSAANVLFQGAIQYLQENDGQTRNYYKVKTTTRGDHMVGQLVHLTYQHDSYIDAQGNPSPTPTNIINVDDEFILIKYDLSYGPDGILYADLLLGEVPKGKTDGQRMVAEKIKSLQTAINNAKAGQSSAPPGGSTASNALLADGSVSLAGDMQVNAGVRIDNTDLSELKISDFVLMASSVEANRGRVLTNGDGIAIADGGAGGQVTLTVLLDAIAGLIFSNGELALGMPSSLSAGSINTVTAVSHSHAIVASDDPGATEQLLKTNPDGTLALTRLDAEKLVLTDRQSGTAYNLYLDNGKLRFEPA